MISELAATFGIKRSAIRQNFNFIAFDCAVNIRAINNKSSYNKYNYRYYYPYR